ncbi:MAG: GNAT family N-acetyltransferase, partial [Bacteroidia bacterium]|nr:GNAT family N-acetyltransferase [Bacteroidia bacterium]
TESQRNKGYGKLLFEQTILLGQSEGFSRLQWQVLDWNTPAIDFYKSFQSQFDSEWLNAWIDF